MCAVRSIIAVILVFSSLAYAQNNRWDKVRYNGGTVETKVDPREWDNHLTITSDLIRLQLNDGQTIEIPTRQVTGVSYGQEAHRRLGTIVVLFGLFHKTRLHYIGVEYIADGKKGGLLLQGDKDDYRGILSALASATHAPLTVSETDRGFVPATLEATVEKNPEEGRVVQAANKEGGTLSLTSTPSGVDVYVDNALAGNTPCKLTIDAGRHTVKLTARDYQVWTRELKVRAGSQFTIDAKMEK
jgi:hypothetical protein